MKLVRILKDAFTITMIRIKWIKHLPGIAIGTIIITPLTFFFLFSFLLGRLDASMILGGIFLPLLSIGITSGREITEDKVNHYFTLYVTNSVSPTSYLLGVGFSNLIPSVIGSILFLILGFVTSSIMLSASQLLVLTGVFLLGWFVSMMLGFMVGIRSEALSAAGSTTNLLWIAFTVLCPLFYPITNFPPMLQYVSMLFYPTHVMFLANSVIGIESPIPLWLSAVVVVFYIAIISYYILHKFEWREK